MKDTNAAATTRTYCFKYAHKTVETIANTIIHYLNDTNRTWRETTNFRNIVCDKNTIMDRKKHYLYFA